MLLTEDTKRKVKKMFVKLSFVMEMKVIDEGDAAQHK